MLRFRDEAQRARVCRALLSLVQREELWSGDGPSEEALDLLEQDGGVLSGGERAMLLLVSSLWSSDSRAKFIDVAALDPRRMARVAELILASTGSPPSRTPPFDSIDAWCERVEREVAVEPGA